VNCLKQIYQKIPLFNRWFHEIENFGGVEEVNAMTVATIGLDGFPKARVVC
jgi:pyridoxamine 5'-phosphate oxidase